MSPLSSELVLVRVPVLRELCRAFRATLSGTALMSTALSSRARNGAGGGIYRAAMGETDDDDEIRNLWQRPRYSVDSTRWISSCAERICRDGNECPCFSQHLVRQSIQTARFLLVLQGSVATAMSARVSRKGSVATAMSARVSRCPSSVFGTVSSCAMGKTDDDDKFGICGGFGICGSDNDETL